MKQVEQLKFATLLFFAISSLLFSSCGTKETTTILIEDKSGFFANVINRNKTIEFNLAPGDVSNEGFAQNTFDLLLRVPEEVLTLNTVQLVFKEEPSTEIRALISSEVQSITAQNRGNTSDPAPHVIVLLQDLNNIELKQ